MYTKAFYSRYENGAVLSLLFSVTSIFSPCFRVKLGPYSQHYTFLVTYKSVH